MPALIGTLSKNPLTIDMYRYAQLYFYARSNTIYCQIVFNNARSVAFSTGVKSLNKFNLEKQIFETDTLNNLKLDEIKHTIYALERELIATSENYNAQQLRTLLLRKQAPKVVLVDLMKTFVSHYTKNENLSIRTVQTYNTRINSLVAYLEFAALTNIIAQNVDLEFVKNFEYYLKAKKYEYCYINKNTKFLCQVLRFAAIKQIIKHNCMDYYKYLKEPVKPKVYLSVAEVRVLEAKDMVIDRLRKVKDCFLFQCYTGLCYVDLKNFCPKKNILISAGVEWVQGNRQKTNSVYQAPLLPRAKKILKKYPQGFNMISNVNYNVYIKEIMQLCDITKPNISSHSGRKTFGNYCIEQGCSLQTVSEMLGHRDTRMTARVYTDVHKSKILKDMVGIQ